MTSTAWERIQQAVEAETGRTKVVSKVLVPQGPLPDVVNVPSDIVKSVSDGDIQQLTVEEGRTTGITEPQVQILLTPKQVQSEEELRSGLTLSIRAANLLSQAQDLLLCQGPNALRFEPLRSRLVQLRNGTPEQGLVSATDEVIEIEPVSRGPKRYGEGTFEKVALAFGRLQARGFPEPYALLLPSYAYGDAFAPLASTLVTPADRIRALATAGFYTTAGLPPDAPDDPANGADPEAPATGLMLAVGGDTMDLVTAVPPKCAFIQEDGRGLVFRIYERFALRIKEPRAIIKLRFV